MQSLTPEQREKWHLVLHEVPVEQGTLSVVEEGESIANTHSHLTLSDRIYIEQTLELRMKFKDIALFIEKDPTKVSKEIRRHRVAKESGRRTALCENRSTCTKQHMCHQRYCNRMCGKCTLHYCHSYCEDAPVCRRLASPPYVCNGCGIRSCRQDSKYYYRAQIAEKGYRELLSESRRGINKTALELDDLDRLISPLLKQGQPLNHIYATHEDEIGCSRCSIYHYLEQGGPVLLTMLFRSCNFMLIFLLARNMRADVCEIFEAIETVLGTEKIQELFEVVLTDNGAEFKNHPCWNETFPVNAVRT